MNRLKTAVLMVLIAAICAIFSGCMNGGDDFSDGISDGTEISTEYNSENEQTSESETVTGDNSGAKAKILRAKISANGRPLYRVSKKNRRKNGGK